MNQALKRLGFLLQLWLLGFGLTVHALALGPAELSPTTRYQRIAQYDELQADLFTRNRPDQINPADYPAEPSQLSELPPFETEEEEEVHSTGAYFKLISASGGASSAFFTACPDIPESLHSGCLQEASPALCRALGVRKHILFQVYRI